MIRLESGKPVFMINASLLRDGECMYKVFLKAVQGFKPRGGGYKADFGNAIHRGLKLWYAGKSLEDCLAAVEKYHREHVNAPEDSEYTVGHALSVMGYYASVYEKGDDIAPLSIEDEPLLEMPFIEKVYSSDDFDVVICGTIDMIGVRNLLGRNYNVVIDHKTTGHSMPDKHLEGFKLSAQGMLYVMHCRDKFPQLGTIDFMINGIYLRKKPYVLRRSQIIHFTQPQLESYRQYVWDFIERLGKAWKLGVFHQNFNKCQGRFNAPCEYADLCFIDDPKDRLGAAMLSYDQETYDPTKFQDDDD